MRTGIWLLLLSCCVIGCGQSFSEQEVQDSVDSATIDTPEELEAEMELQKEVERSN